MNRDNAKKLSDVYEPIQPSEDLVRKTEALMRAEPQKICSVPRRRPMVLRAAALAACFILVCSAAFVYILRASPSDFSGKPGPGLAAAPTERELRMIAQPMMTFELSSDVPPLGELIAGLDVAAMNACGANAGELIVKAVCTGLAEYLPAAPADAGFASVFLSDLVITDVLYAQNAPHDYGDGNKITALLFRYDVAPRPAVSPMKPEPLFPSVSPNVSPPREESTDIQRGLTLCCFHLSLFCTFFCPSS